MKSLMFVFYALLIKFTLDAQPGNAYQTGISAEENLKAVSGLSPTSVGAMGFDTRYKGIKGSPMLFDTLLPSFVKINNEEKYLQIDADIDLLGNSIRFMHPRTKQLIYLSGNRINEIIISKGSNEMLFRTIKGSDLNLKTDDHIFYQLLNSDPYQLIKVSFKEFTEADFKQAYSPGRQFDEYETANRYYVISPDGKIHQCKLSKKSLVKVFPDKKDQIKKLASGKSFPDKESMVIEILRNFR